MNYFPRIHLKRQISFQDAIVGLLNLTGHKVSLKTFNHIPGAEPQKKDQQAEYSKESTVNANKCASCLEINMLSR